MHVCLILFPSFRLLTYVFAREVLRLANDCAGQRLFSWKVRTVTGAPVPADDGTHVAGDLPDWYGAQGFDLVLLCAGDMPLGHLPMGLRAFLSRADAAGATLGGLETGALILARLGLLDDREAVLPALPEDDAATAFPGIALSDAAYAFDRQRLTSTGGLVVGDALLAWIARVQGAALAARTAEMLGHGRLRETGACQRLAQSTDPMLASMQAIMTAHIDRPLPLERIAAELDLSPKQLRLRCRKGMDRTPAQAYLGLRLDRAAQLVRDTDLSVLEVARATGFASPSAFTRSYHARFGRPPRAQRKARAPA